MHTNTVHKHEESGKKKIEAIFVRQANYNKMI